MNINKYNIYNLVECTSDYEIYGTILLNKKHTIEDFQQAIYDVKNDFYENGVFAWTIQMVFADERFNKFDYKYIQTNGNNNIEI